MDNKEVIKYLVDIKNILASYSERYSAIQIAIETMQKVESGELIPQEKHNALLTDINYIVKEADNCLVCSHWTPDDKEPCEFEVGYCNFQWRGIKSEFWGEKKETILTQYENYIEEKTDEELIDEITKANEGEKKEGKN